MGGEKLKVTINGKETDIEEKTNLLDFLKKKGIDKNLVVIEYNKDIVKDIDDIEFKDGDDIEILRIVGGG